MPMFGYARVSTRDQDFNAQVAELMAAGCAKVYREKASGAKTDRAELAKVMSRMEPGDVLVVCRLDRLARSTRDLLNIIEALTQRGAGFKSLKDTWADTTSPHGRLMLTVLGGLAEFERDLIRARTSEGRERAKARGVKLGHHDDTRNGWSCLFAVWRENYLVPQGQESLRGPNGAWLDRPALTF